MSNTSTPLKVVVFGAGHFGGLYAQQEENVEIVAFADNNAALWGRSYFGHRVIPPGDILRYEFDRIVICIDDYNDAARLEGAVAMDEVFLQLQRLGINEQKIAVNGIGMRNDRRVIDLRKLAYELRDISGAVAESGVYRGHFAGYINEVFSERKMYLFDTFEGFDIRDKNEELSESSKRFLESWSDFFHRGNEWIALARCTYKENVIIRKGFVPETFSGLENERFVYVNLDMDLYKPTLAALRFFVPRLVSEGVIWVHDYFNAELSGIKQAIEEFNKEYSFFRIPTGDVLTVALRGFEERDLKK